jgi:hypothetical protein
MTETRISAFPPFSVYGVVAFIESVEPEFFTAEIAKAAEEVNLGLAPQ